MKNERVLHMLPPHSLGLSSYLPPTASPTTNNFFFFFMSLHNINGRRRPTVWDLSGSFIYNFFFLFLENSLILSTHQQESSRLVWTVIFLFQPIPPPPSRPVFISTRQSWNHFSVFSFLFIYLFKTIFFCVLLFSFYLYRVQLLLYRPKWTFFIFCFFLVEVVVGGKEGKYRIFDV